MFYVKHSVSVYYYNTPIIIVRATNYFNMNFYKNHLYLHYSLQILTFKVDYNVGKKNIYKN